MADLISRSERTVYLKVHMPRELFEALVSDYHSENRALREVRRQWETLLQRVTDLTRRRVM